MSETNFGRELRSAVKKSIHDGRFANMEAAARHFGYAHGSALDGLTRDAFLPNTEVFALMCREWPQLKPLLEVKSLKSPRVKASAKTLKVRKEKKVFGAAPTPSAPVSAVDSSPQAVRFCTTALMLMGQPAAKQWSELMEMAARAGLTLTQAVTFLRTAEGAIHGNA